MNSEKQPKSPKSPLLPTPEWHPHPIMRVYRDNQIAVPIAILTAASATALFHPTHPISQFVILSMNAEHVVKSRGDVVFVTLAVVLWTVLRALVMEYLLRPLGRSLRCRPKMLDRFAEQGWLVVYYLGAFLAGLNIAVHSPYWQSTAHFWIDYPHQTLTRSFKTYYLLQLGFWIQQLLVIHIEKPRKDHWQMFTHHVVTCLLIISSYTMNFSRIGTAILVMMDVGDILLSSAKCLNYIQWRRTCDTTFIVFVFVWIYSRHYLYYQIFMSVYAEAPALLKWKWDPASGSFVSDAAWYVFVGLLGVLQLLLMMWFVLMLRVIAKVVRGKGAEDNRSDDEDEASTNPSARRRSSGIQSQSKKTK